MVKGCKCSLRVGGVGKKVGKPLRSLVEPNALATRQPLMLRDYDSESWQQGYGC
jgi:hypothetical protein